MYLLVLVMFVYIHIDCSNMMHKLATSRLPNFFDSDSIRSTRTCFESGKNTSAPSSIKKTPVPVYSRSHPEGVRTGFKADS